MTRFAAARNVLVGALIGVGLATIAVIVYCLVFFWPWADYFDRGRGVLRFGMVVFFYVAGPVGGALGAATGLVTYVIRRGSLSQDGRSQ